MTDMMRRMGRLGGRSSGEGNSGVRSCTACGISMATSSFRPHAVSNGTGDFWRYVCPLCAQWLDVAVHVPEWPGWERRDARRVDGVVVAESLSSARHRWRAEAARLLAVEEPEQGQEAPWRNTQGS